MFTSIKITLFLFMVTSYVCSLQTLPDRAIIKSILSIDKPLNIIGFVCWDQVRKVEFAKELFRHAGLSFVVVWPPSSDHIGVSTENIHRTMFLIDLECQNIQPFLLEAEIKHMFKSPFAWIMINSVTNRNLTELNHSVLNNKSIACENMIFSSKNVETIPKQIRNITISVDSDVTLISDVSGTNLWCSYLVYKRNPRDEEWKAELPVDYNRSDRPRQSVTLGRMDLHGTVIRVCYVLTVNDSLLHLEDYKDSQSDTITKVNYILTMHAINMLNATRVSSFQDTWGYKDDNGNWNGMMGELTSFKADVGGSPLFFTADRVSEIDYIAMPTPTRSKFVFKQPKLSYVSNVFLLPFQEAIWISTAGLMVLLALSLFVAVRIERAPDENSPKLQIGEVVMIALGALCQQGSSFSFRGPVGRIIMLLLFLSLMFLYTSYSANVVALLQSSSSRIQTLSDLLNSRLKFAIHDTVFNRHYFATATEPVRKAIYEKKIAPLGETPKFISLKEGIQNLRQGLFAFHMEIGVGYKVVEELFYENEKCGLQEIQYLQVVDPWLAVQKNSSYKEMFKIGFRRIQESGIQFRENWKLYTKKPRCSGINSNFVSVGIVDSLPAMKLLLYGYLASLVMLVFEIFITKMKIKRNN